MKNSFFMNQNQLTEWVKAAKGIKERYGTDKALGYLIGEKFYALVRILCSDKKRIHSIDEERKKPDYNPVQETGDGKYRTTINLDDIYEERKKRLNTAEEVLNEFSVLIKNSFKTHEIRKYLDSNPRLGPLGHIFSEREHRSWVEKGVVEHSLETEIEDALIFGEMIKYLGVKMEWFD